MELGRPLRLPPAPHPPRGFPARPGPGPRQPRRCSRRPAAPLLAAAAAAAALRCRRRCLLVAEAKTVPALPSEVDDYRVRAVCVSPSPPLPNRDQICTLVVSDVEDEEAMDKVMWHPAVGSSAQQAISLLRDAFGVLGVWPAAWVAAQRVMRFCQSRSRPVRMLELGCGAGLPSLCALASGAEVVATDLEELPLKLLQAAAEAQDLPGLEIKQMDVLAAAGFTRGRHTPCPSEAERFDVIVCSDCLYKPDVARAMATLIARALLAYPTTRVVVTDANRQGREDFLDELDTLLGLSLGNATPPYFEAVPVPSWAAELEVDPFDGSMPDTVGLLKLA
ncbi:unnamed protein product [Effrenium voratum]|nr:unnamed protein product [Effrenium voratum]